MNTLATTPPMQLNTVRTVNDLLDRIVTRDPALTAPPTEAPDVRSVSRLDQREVLVLKNLPRTPGSLRIAIGSESTDTPLRATIGCLLPGGDSSLETVRAERDPLLRLTHLFENRDLIGSVAPKWVVDELIRERTTASDLISNLRASTRIIVPFSEHLPHSENGEHGAIAVERPYGVVVWRKIDGGVPSSATMVRRVKTLPKARSRALVWPPVDGAPTGLRRVPLPAPQIVFEPGTGLLISKAEALPKELCVPRTTIVLVPGTETWKKLAQRNVLVHGSFDGLGEEELTTLAQSFPEVSRWIKFGHTEAIETSATTLIPTYRLEAECPAPSVSGFTHFFWRSGSQFEYYLETNPELRRAWHGSGPGHTHATIARHLPDRSRAGVFAGFQDFLELVL